MSMPSFHEKHFASAHRRLLEASIADFFAVNFPNNYGPDIRSQIAKEVLARVETQCPSTAQVRPGQCVWNAVARETRADSCKLRLVPVILTLVSDDDIVQRRAGRSLPQIREASVARVLEEAYQQGALLSMRDLALLTWQSDSLLTVARQAWEVEHDRTLPHPGSLQDMGSCLTHKTVIVVKAVYQGQDPRQVARETHHTQAAVDRYLKDFHRVRTCYRQHPELAFVCQVTGMSRHLVIQYIAIIQKYEKSS